MNVPSIALATRPVTDFAVRRIDGAGVGQGSAGACEPCWRFLCISRRTASRIGRQATSRFRSIISSTGFSSRRYSWARECAPATNESPFGGRRSLAAVRSGCHLTALSIMLGDAAAVELIHRRRATFLPLSLLPRSRGDDSVEPFWFSVTSSARRRWCGFDHAVFLAGRPPRATGGVDPRPWSPALGTHRDALGPDLRRISGPFGRRRGHDELEDDGLGFDRPGSRRPRHRGRELAALCVDFPGSHVPPGASLRRQDPSSDRPSRGSEPALHLCSSRSSKTTRRLSSRSIASRRADEAAAGFAEGSSSTLTTPISCTCRHGARGSRQRCRGSNGSAPAAAFAVASLAFEVGDTAGAIAMLDRGIELWPEHRVDQRVKLALQDGDRAVAHRVVASWFVRFPRVCRSPSASEKLGME